MHAKVRVALIGAGGWGREHARISSRPRLLRHLLRYPQTHAVEVSGTQGRLLIEDTVRRYSFSPHDSEVVEVWQAGYFNDVDRSFYLTFDKHVAALLANFKAGKAPPVHARAGRRALQLARACIDSFESGRRVDVETASFAAADPAPVTVPPPSP